MNTCFSMHELYRIQDKSLATLMVPMMESRPFGILYMLQ